MKPLFHFLFFLSLYTNDLSAQVLSVAASKMNVFYIGVDNPITIAVESVADEKLRVSIQNGYIRKIDKGLYIVTVTIPGEAVVTVEWDNQILQTKFRVKAFRDIRPVFKKDTLTCKGSQEGSRCKPIGIIVEAIGDFDIKCEIKSYTVVYLPKNRDPQEFTVKNQDFPSDLIATMQKAKTGDIFNFLNIRCQCPSDHNPELAGGLQYLVRD